MTNLMRFVATLLVTVPLAACTSYKMDGIGGGYQDTPLTANTYRIDVRGNGFTSEARVRMIALVRAADVTAEAGYQRFVIEGASSGETRKLVGFTPGTYQANTTGTITWSDNTGWINTSTTGTSTPAQPIVVSNERVTFVIRMLKPDAAGFEDGLDAQTILKRYGPEVGR